MKFRVNYLDLIVIRENFNKSFLEVDENSIDFVNAFTGFVKQYLGVATNLTTVKILDCPVLAQYGIVIAKSTKKI